MTTLNYEYFQDGQKQLHSVGCSLITNDIRKLSIIDIPSINTPSNTQIDKNAFCNQKRKKNSIFDFLYQKDQKLLLILAKSK